MKFSDQDIMYLRGTCSDRFVEIPEGCPPKIMAGIINLRARKIGYQPQPSQAQEPSSDLRDKLAAVALL